MQLTIDGVTREEIESSNLASIGYEPERHVLAVEFKSGLVLHYGNVPPEKATEFYCAQSRGRFYAQEIRGKFSAQTMTGPCRACQANGPIGATCAECGTDQHFMVERRLQPDRETQTPSDVDQVVR